MPGLRGPEPEQSQATASAGEISPSARSSWRPLFRRYRQFVNIRPPRLFLSHAGAEATGLPDEAAIDNSRPRGEAVPKATVRKERVVAERRDRRDRGDEIMALVDPTAARADRQHGERRHQAENGNGSDRARRQAWASGWSLTTSKTALYLRDGDSLAARRRVRHDSMIMLGAPKKTSASDQAGKA